jgi:hypothetical protein
MDLDKFTSVFYGNCFFLIFSQFVLKAEKMLAAIGSVKKGRVITSR